MDASGIERVCDAVARLATLLATIVCGFLILATSFSVVVYQRGITISWLDDLLRMLLIWLVFLGSVAPVWRRDHINMDAVYTRFPPGLRRLVDMLIAVMGLVICGYLAWMSLGSVLREREFNTLLPSGELLVWPQTLSIPVSFGLIALAYLGVLIMTIAGRTPPPPSTPST